MEWWEVLVQQTINGLTRGAVFALIALGYTMVYGIIALINFAHGDVFMLGLFISLSWFTLLGVTKTLTAWQLVTILPLVFVLTMLTTAALNVAIDRAAYRPLRHSTRLAPLITAIGVSFMLENVAGESDAAALSALSVGIMSMNVHAMRKSGSLDPNSGSSAPRAPRTQSAHVGDWIATTRTNSAWSLNHARSGASPVARLPTVRMEASKSLLRVPLQGKCRARAAVPERITRRTTAAAAQPTPDRGIPRRPA